MNGRKRVISLILIMVATTLSVSTIAIYLLYRAAFEEQTARLVETAKSQARLIEAVARFDRIYSTDYPGGSEEATLSQIIDAHRHYEGFGDTGEFTLAKRQGDQIIFLLRHRHSEVEQPKPVPFDSKLAEPMRRALAGLSGTIVGPDYRGKIVLAAHEPVAELDLGIVAKIDLDEVRAPFIRAGKIAVGLAIVIILTGVWLFLRISEPIIKRLEEHARHLEELMDAHKESEARLRSIFETTGSVILLLSTDYKIIEFNFEAERVYGVKKEDALGKNYLDYFIPANKQEAVKKDLHQILEAQVSMDFEHPSRCRNGKERIILWNLTRLEDSKDRAIGIIAIGQDITARKIAEESSRLAHEELSGINKTLEERVKRRSEELIKKNQQLVQAEKFAAIGKIADRVAHELRNPLTIVGGFAQRIYKNTPDEDPNKVYCNIIVEETQVLEEKIAQIIEREPDG